MCTDLIFNMSMTRRYVYLHYHVRVLEETDMPKINKLQQKLGQTITVVPNGDYGKYVIVWGKLGNPQVFLKDCWDVIHRKKTHEQINTYLWNHLNPR